MLLIAIPTGRTSARDTVPVLSSRRSRRAATERGDVPVPADSDRRNGHNPPERALPLDDPETDAEAAEHPAGARDLDDTVDASAARAAATTDNSEDLVDSGLDGGNRAD
jgi:hypothetical protein